MANATHRLITISHIHIDSLKFSRFAPELIGEARYLLAVKTNLRTNRKMRKQHLDVTTWTDLAQPIPLEATDNTASVTNIYQ